MDLFYDAFITGEPEADVDESSVIDFDDVDTFEQIYVDSTGG